MFNFINLCISYGYLYHNDHCTFLQNKTDLFFLPWLKYTGFLCLILLRLLSPSSHPHGVKVWYCTLVSLSAWEPQKLQADIDIDRTACFGCISHSHNTPSLGAVKEMWYVCMAFAFMLLQPSVEQNWSVNRSSSVCTDQLSPIDIADKNCVSYCITSWVYRPYYSVITGQSSPWLDSKPKYTFLLWFIRVSGLQTNIVGDPLLLSFYPLKACHLEEWTHCHFIDETPDHHVITRLWSASNLPHSQHAASSSVLKNPNKYCTYCIPY